MAQRMSLLRQLILLRRLKQITRRIQNKILTHVVVQGATDQREVVRVVSHVATNQERVLDGTDICTR